MAAAHQSERRLGGAEHAHWLRPILVERRRARQFPRVSRGGVLVGAGDDDRGEPAEWRVAALLARGDLGGIERLAILRDQGAHHRMIRLMRLEEPQADAGVTPGTADHLMQQLKGALRGARIAIA